MKKPTNTSSPVAILGAGSWGSAVAIHLASRGQPVLLWGRDEQLISDMLKHRMNQRYLPNAPLPPSLTPTSSLDQCQSEASELIIAVPSHAFASLLPLLKKPTHGISWLTKGIDMAHHVLLSQLVGSLWGEDFSIAVISGPSFAKEVAQQLPTALVMAGNNPKYLKTIHNLLHHDNIRVYLTDDTIGVQLCGAVKNVLAIACGISDGLNFGANAKAALITRGLSEMSRLGMSLGARQETFMGLAGIGDLVLTCTDDQSRNRRFGLQLGQNVDIMTAEKSIGQVVEGKSNAIEVCTMAAIHHIEMPICEAVCALLQGQISAKDAVAQLMRRPAREE
ncbi:MAG: NAD(P)-dependent glycerol-3-phosphate dehydrogenase [Legionellales bacterium]|nr:NAD(P)-dependent glycerol-3-phosphate dehydrogenase [Legionellales bacterium]